MSSTEESLCGLPWDQEGAIALVFGYAVGADTMLPGELVATSCETAALGPVSVMPSFGSSSPPLDGASPIGIAPSPTPEGGSVRLSWGWIAAGVLLLAGVTVGAWPHRRASGTGSPV